MSLRLTDEYDPEDWDRYQGKGPMRTMKHYVCDRCDKVRCHLVIEEADDGDEWRAPRSMVFDEMVRMPCPLASPACFERADDPKEVGWDGTRYRTMEERDRDAMERWKPE